MFFAFAAGIFFPASYQQPRQCFHAVIRSLASAFTVPLSRLSPFTCPGFYIDPFPFFCKETAAAAAECSGGRLFFLVLRPGNTSERFFPSPVGPRVLPFGTASLSTTRRQADVTEKAISKAAPTRTKTIPTTSVSHSHVRDCALFSSL